MWHLAGLMVVWWIVRRLWRWGVLVGLFYWLLHVTQHIKSFGL